MKRYISILLAVVMLVSIAPTAVLADSNMTASENIKLLIKSWEGCVLRAYKAHPSEEHWTIGYGHYGSDVYEGMTITEEQADAYFEQDIKAFENAVNRWNDKYSLNLTQNQFDAMLSLTYNFGTGWVEYYDSWRLSRYVQAGFKDGYGNRISDLELADSFGVLCSAGGEILPGLLTRRINEAEIFLYNNYHTDNTNFVYLILDAGAGTVKGNRVVIYYKGSPYGTLPTATRSGYTLSYWKDTKTGSAIYSSTVADVSRSLVAVWSDGSTPSGMCPLGDSCPSKSFTDVPASFWAHNDIDAAVSNGLFKGTSATTFSPDIAMTRAMLVTVLYRLGGNGEDVSGMENPFNDLDEEGYYYDAVLWASEHHIANGFVDGSFKPNDTLTREQLATMLHRYANYMGYPTDVYSDIGDYEDAHDVGEYARESMCWAVGAGIIKGLTSTTISPKTSATRAQVATMLIRFAGSML